MTSTPSPALFDHLDRLGRIDLTSGAWKFDHNVRRARCGRCWRLIPAGEGRPYNEFMSDMYRASTRYLCRLCSAAVKDQQA